MKIIEAALFIWITTAAVMATIGAVSSRFQKKPSELYLQWVFLPIVLAIILFVLPFSRNRAGIMLKNALTEIGIIRNTDEE